ncbi:MAG TPA: hypothetical protein VFV63_22140, partial [Ilumatobacteraceae bacterium]|nr:hypothetical protein [Ilumatobacteraceae bacterium]
MATAVALVALSACSSAVDPRASQPGAPDVSTAVVGFDDDLNHFAVTITGSRAVEVLAVDIADGAPIGSGALSVTHADG